MSQHRGHPGSEPNRDDARLLPHLRARKPFVYVAPDNGATHIDTLQLGRRRSAHTRAAAAAGQPGELRGIPVVGARGVGGVSPGTQPEQVTINKLSRTERRHAA